MTEKGEMNILDVFLISIYIHFYKMKERGRQVVPWFQTAFAISLFTAISGVLFAKVVGGNNSFIQSVSEFTFLTIFIAIGGICFFSVKHYLFDTGRHLVLAENFMKKNTSTRFLFKFYSIAFILLIPFLLGFIIWLKAKQ